MMPLFKAELLKLRTVRSTYITMILAFLIIGFTAFYIEGYRGMSSAGAGMGVTDTVSQVVINSATTASTFAAIVAILFMAHEYRYNTITYTLITARSRAKVLLAKIGVMALYGAVFTLVCAAFATLCFYLGRSFTSSPMPAVGEDILAALAKALYFSIAYSLTGLLLVTFIRNIAAAVVLLFMVPSTIEPLLGLLLKENMMYLPFTALGQVLGYMSGFSGPDGEPPTMLKPASAAALFTLYLVVSWLLAWRLFQKRDTN